jgi:hypothetical protein
VSRASAVARFLAPVAVAFVAQRLLLAAAALAAGVNPFSADALCRWDSAFYLDIAVSGYRPLTHCTPETHFPPSAWCGNAGWFPGYPWAIAVAGWAGTRPATAATLIAAAAQFACLALVWTGLGDRRHPLLLALAAFFPGTVYMAAAFPVSCLVFCLLACTLACDRGRFGAAAAASGAAATLYPTGIVIAPVVAAWGALARRPKALWVALAAAAGFAIVLFTMEREAGAWDAYFKVQAHYGFVVGSGFETWLARLKPLVNPRYRDAKGVLAALQSLLALAVVGAVLARRRALLSSARGSLLLLLTLGYWLVHVAVGVSLHRNEALLLPAVLALPPLPVRVLATFAVAAAGIAAGMSFLFFRGVLV